MPMPVALPDTLAHTEIQPSRRRLAPPRFFFDFLIHISRSCIVPECRACALLHLSSLPFPSALSVIGAICAHLILPVWSLFLPR
ncbi:hypothetical protein B0H17DRAFT_1213063 [Mycena rosella]|uniref:Uncharacterized protein n=1 Tax=Mycena rosella TaxID=1033263 RepID=A0AAD7CTE0_MYCRO|nr:hypothetical protein B0H17DRAFT_1213063 [Mycena rosella]